MAITNYEAFGWNQNYSYQKYDFAYSVPTYYYATKDSFGDNPVSTFVYTPTQTTRTDNVTRLTFTQTGTFYFQPGSLVQIAGMQPDSSNNYTGIVLAAGSGYIDYLNPGLNVSNAASAGTVTAPIHPYWTTGFYWLPSWTSDVTHDQLVIKSQLGEGYSQRQNTVINSNSLSWNLVFENRTDREIMALGNFIENKGGATCFPINFPLGLLYNKPNLKYTAGPLKHTPTSYGLNNASMQIQQVFDIG